jgi:hypothetical protein
MASARCGWQEADRLAAARMDLNSKRCSYPRTTLAVALGAPAFAKGRRCFCLCTFAARRNLRPEQQPTIPTAKASDVARLTCRLKTVPAVFVSLPFVRARSGPEDRVLPRGNPLGVLSEFFSRDLRITHASQSSRRQKQCSCHQSSERGASFRGNRRVRREMATDATTHSDVAAPTPDFAACTN